MSFALKDKVVVSQSCTEFESYKWMPDLRGKIGTICEIIEVTPVAHEPLDEPIYKVQFEEPFQVGILPKKEDGTEYGMGYDVDPIEWQPETIWTFMQEEISAVPKERIVK